MLRHSEARAASEAAGRMSSWADELDIDDSDILGTSKRRENSQRSSLAAAWPPLPPPAILSSADPQLSIAASGVLKRFRKPRPSQNPPALLEELDDFGLDFAKKRKQSFDSVPCSALKTICGENPRLGSASRRQIPNTKPNHNGSLNFSSDRVQSICGENPNLGTATCRESPSFGSHAARRESPSLEQTLCSENPNLENGMCIENPNLETVETCVEAFACTDVHSLGEEHGHLLSSHGYLCKPAIRETPSFDLGNAEFCITNRDEEAMSPCEASRDELDLAHLGHSKETLVPSVAGQILKRASDFDRLQQKKLGLARLQKSAGDDMALSSRTIACASQQAHNLENMFQNTPDRPLGAESSTGPTDLVHGDNSECSEFRGTRSLHKVLPYQIPGPAGVVQRGLGQKTHPPFGNNRVRKDNPAPCRRASFLDDADFQSGAWLGAINYLEKTSSSVSTISSVKTSRTENRIPKLVAVIKTCIPNGCGDVAVNLKDRSDTIGGTVNRRVMTETEFGRLIEPGAVILLHQVAVFSPTPYAHYLNITINNVEQVFGKGVQFSKGECSRAAIKTGFTGGDQINSLDKHLSQFEPCIAGLCAQQRSGKQAASRSGQLLEEDDIEVLLAPPDIGKTGEQRPNEVELHSSNDRLQSRQSHLPTQLNPLPVNLDTRKQSNNACSSRTNDGYDQLLDDTDLFQCLQIRSAVL